MRRGYTAERYLARLADARAAIKELAVTTDLIVGFPGETDDDAERTLEVVAEAEFDSAYTFIFSPRPGTSAAMKDDSSLRSDCRSIRETEGGARALRSRTASRKGRSGRRGSGRGSLEARFRMSCRDEPVKESSCISRTPTAGNLLREATRGCA